MVLQFFKNIYHPQNSEETYINSLTNPFKCIFIKKNVSKLVNLSVLLMSFVKLR